MFTFYSTSVHTCGGLLLLFFLLHSIKMTIKLDYGYNMKVLIVVGALISVMHLSLWSLISISGSFFELHFSVNESIWLVAMVLQGILSSKQRSYT